MWYLDYFVPPKLVGDSLFVKVKYNVFIFWWSTYILNINYFTDYSCCQQSSETCNRYGYLLLGCEG